MEQKVSVALGFVVFHTYEYIIVLYAGECTNPKCTQPSAITATDGLIDDKVTITEAVNGVS